MTVMSDTLARAAHSAFVKPRSAASSTIRCTLNRTRGSAVIDIANQTIRPDDSRCQSQNATTTNNANQGAATIHVEMAGRPVFDAELGRFFENLRIERKFKHQRQAAHIAKTKLRLKHVTYQRLQQLEAGKTKNPDPRLLRDLAVLYSVPYETLVERWVAHRFGLRDPISHGDRSGFGASRSGGLADDQTRVRELEGELEDYRRMVSKLHDITAALVRLAARGREGETTTREQSS